MQNDLHDVDRVVLAMKGCVADALLMPAAFQFEISMTEALVNLVKHAKPRNPAAPVDICLHETDAAIHVDIFDPAGAQAFDLRDHAQPLKSIDPLAEGGRGLGLILQCASDVSYGPKSGRMCLSLSFLKSGD